MMMLPIQKIAGWTTTKQLRTYDLSDQQDVFKIELAKRGLIKDKKFKIYTPKTKPCLYCGELVGFSESICPKCKRLVDPSEIKKQFESSKKDKEAEQEMREVFTFALKNPKMSFMEIMDKFREG